MAVIITTLRDCSVAALYLYAVRCGEMAETAIVESCVRV